MSDWTAGYVADIGYTFGYYTELNPLRVKLAFLNNGLAMPEMATACELGFGQGLSANIHAAASPVQWHGTDFNPAQAGFAQELARVTDSGAKLYDDAFDEFSRRDDLPDFDYIGLHGIWSWISDENRAVIADFVKRKLKVGGVLYISYNTLPGWAAFAPMRHLMTEHAEIIGAEGRGIVSRINDALDFSEKLLATNPIYARANPQISERIKKLKEQNRHYLAHEYFNRDWHPMYFATLAEWLEPAKLQYACSAHYLDQIEGINLTSDQQAFMTEISDPMFRETVRDFMVNQQFRRDYWVKGARKLSALEQSEGLRATKVILTAYRPDVSLKVNAALGEATMNESVYSPILDLLSDNRPHTLGEMEHALKSKNIHFNQIIQAAMVLGGAGHVAAVQEDAAVARVKPAVARLNSYLMNKARGSNDVSYLASPVTGGGVNVGRMQMLYMLAMQQGLKQPRELAQYVWQIISSQGQKLAKEGKSLESAEDNLAELLSQANDYLSKRMPLLRSLQIMA